MARANDVAALLEDACRELARAPAVFESLTAGLDAAGWRARPHPTEWSPVEIICHLRDEEAEDFGARMRVVLAGGAGFMPIDPERWATERRYREADPRNALAAFRAHRDANLALLGSVAGEQLSATVEHATIGRLSGLDLLVAWVTHDRLHLSQLAGTLARLWADGWTPLRAEYAGPIPYAGDPGA